MRTQAKPLGDLSTRLTNRASDPTFQLNKHKILYQVYTKGQNNTTLASYYDVPSKARLTKRSKSSESSTTQIWEMASSRVAYQVAGNPVQMNNLYSIKAKYMWQNYLFPGCPREHTR